MSDSLDAEKSAVTRPSVVAGLGFPADRDEQSAEPTGWQANDEAQQITQIDTKVSRETF